MVTYYSLSFISLCHKSLSDQQRQSKELVPKRAATSVAWTWFVLETLDTEQKTAKTIKENSFMNLQKMCFIQMCIFSGYE